MAGKLKLDVFVEEIAGNNNKQRAAKMLHLAAWKSPNSAAVQAMPYNFWAYPNGIVGATKVVSDEESFQKSTRDFNDSSLSSW